MSIPDNVCLSTISVKQCLYRQSLTLRSSPSGSVMSTRSLPPTCLKSLEAGNEYSFIRLCICLRYQNRNLDTNLSSWKGLLCRVGSRQSSWAPPHNCKRLQNRCSISTALRTVLIHVRCSFRGHCINFSYLLFFLSYSKSNINTFQIPSQSFLM